MRLLIPIFLSIYIGLNAQTLLKEDFNSLDNWEELTFQKIQRVSTYETNHSILEASSNNSASGIKFKTIYNIYKYPLLQFRWKVSNTYKKGNAQTKEGDDYPIRIYVMFEYNPKEASFFQSLKYELIKSIYKQYPPHSSLNYIWSNKIHTQRIITSAYTSQAKMILLNSGNTLLNTWQEHVVNVLEDYIKAFGINPPVNVTLAIMNDSDNTGEYSSSYIDFIEVKSE